MKLFPSACFRRLVLTSLLASFASFAARAQPTGSYTLTKILDSNTAVPGSPGETFTGLVGDSNQVVALDGTSVAFVRYSDGETNGGPTDSAVWSTRSAGGTPTLLVDRSTAVPGTVANSFTNFIVKGIGAGMVVFSANEPNGDGLYAVPVSGGTITTLVDSGTAIPGSTANFSFAAGDSVTVHGSQVAVCTTSGFYFIPVTGGAITPYADSSTPLLDPSGNYYTVPGGPGEATQEVDFANGVVGFAPRGTDFQAAIFSGPATGLTLGSNGDVDNAQFIVSSTSPIPGGSGSAFQDYFDVFVTATGGIVFDAETSSTFSTAGIYASLSGVNTTLVDDNTVPMGATSPLGFIAVGQGSTAVNGPQVYFYGESDGSEFYKGIFTVPAVGGEVVPVVTNNNPVPGVKGSTFSDLQSFYSGVSNGNVLFYGYYPNPAGSGTVYGLYLATPTGVTAPLADDLALSTHAGGDTGPVTVTATVTTAGTTIAAGATVQLLKTGLAAIDASSITVNATGTSVTAVLDLKAKALGMYDFVITNPHGTIITQAATFTVEAATGPNIYTDLLGRIFLHAGKAQPYTILVGNSGDVDAAAVPVIVNFPSIVTCQVVTTIMEPFRAGLVSEDVDYSQYPLTITDGDHSVLPLIVPRVPAGGTVTIQVLFTAPDESKYAHDNVLFSVTSGVPFVDAETGRVPTTDDGFRPVDRDEEHTDKLALPVSCGLTFFNTIVDCTSTFFPPLQTLKCGASLGLSLANGLAGVSSNTATPTQGVISQSQAAAGVAAALVGCVPQKLGTTIVPGFGTAVAIVNCALDVYLLSENCIAPATPMVIQILTSGDPNELSGSAGDGSAAHYLTGAEPLRYIVSFENEATATAPAQNVTITNPLDASLDLSTFSLGPIGFGSTVLNPPAGSQNFATVVDLRPATNLLVQVTATLDVSTRQLAYSFVSLDPATNQPTTDPTAGFLPPDVNAPAGDGFVVYYAKPIPAVPTGTAVKDQASIVFDANPAIATSVWVNTIDNTAPKSNIAPLPKKKTSAHIALHLTSTDKGSGVRSYNVYVAEDGGKFELAIRNVVRPKVIYTGVTGHAYRFFSQAVDRAGNVEPLKHTAEARTEISGADLVGNWVGKVTDQKKGGRLELAGSFTVKNQSNTRATAAGSFVRFYLSKDATLSSNDRIIGQDAPFGVLAPSQGVEVSLEEAKLPAGESIAGKYLIAVIDPEHSVAETDYTNNAVTYGPFP